MIHSSTPTLMCPCVLAYKRISRHASVPNMEIHIFSAHFFSKLVDGGPQAVENWTRKRGVDVFTKCVVLIPIVEDLHWSLCVLLNPGQVMNALNTEAISEHDPLGCILFFDSLKAHKIDHVRDNIIRWLNSEWDRLGKFEDPDRPMPFTSRSFPVFAPTGTVLLIIAPNCIVLLV
jgi:Ulp1 family protease